MSLLCRSLSALRHEPSERDAKISPCTLRLLTPALSSFGEEREDAGAASTVQRLMGE
jgi:hypothetical protein